MKHKQKAFSLFELLAVILIAGITLTLAIPSGQNLIQRNQATTQINRIVAALNLARSEAIKRGVPVIFCKSADGQTCSGTWSDGQILFADEVGDRKIRSDDQLIRILGPINPGATLSWKGFRSNNFIQMEPSGIGRIMSGSFQYCPAKNQLKFAKKIILSRSGRVRLENRQESCTA